MKYSGEHLFVYGTLLVPQVLRQVCGKVSSAESAILHDFARFGIRGKPYPGIVPMDGACVTGMLYWNLRPAAWQRLDAYEDYFYQRQCLQVECATGEYRLAWSYVIPAQKRHKLTAHEWSLGQFRQRHLQGFLQRIRSRRKY